MAIGMPQRRAERTARDLADRRRGVGRVEHGVAGATRAPALRDEADEHRGVGVDDRREAGTCRRSRPCRPRRRGRGPAWAGTMSSESSWPYSGIPASRRSVSRAARPAGTSPSGSPAASSASQSAGAADVRDVAARSRPRRCSRCGRCARHGGRPPKRTRHGHAVVASARRTDGATSTMPRGRLDDRRATGPCTAISDDVVGARRRARRRIPRRARRARGRRHRGCRRSRRPGSAARRWRYTMTSSTMPPSSVEHQRVLRLAVTRIVESAPASA